MSYLCTHFNSEFALLKMSKQVCTAKFVLASAYLITSGSFTAREAKNRWKFWPFVQPRHVSHCPAFSGHGPAVTLAHFTPLPLPLCKTRLHFCLCRYVDSHGRFVCSSSTRVTGIVTPRRHHGRCAKLRNERPDCKYCSTRASSN